MVHWATCFGTKHPYFPTAPPNNKLDVLRGFREGLDIFQIVLVEVWGTCSGDFWGYFGMALDRFQDSCWRKQYETYCFEHLRNVLTPIKHISYIGEIVLIYYKSYVRRCRGLLRAM